jgi:tetratricopeptide (TPR) repeat protein
MLVFITEMVAKGFWWAILAYVIVCGIFGVLGWILGKINKVSGIILQYLPGTLFVFYIWHIRENIGWLILSIVGIIFLPFTIIQKIRYASGSVIEARNHFNRARIYFDQKKFDESIIEYKKAFELDPKFADAMVECADAWLCKEDHDEAKKCLLEALVINQKIAKAHNNLGILYSMEGEKEKARNEFTIAAEINPIYISNIGTEGSQKFKISKSFIKDNTLLGDTFDNQGIEMQRQKNYSSALQLHLKAIEFGTSEPKITYNNIAGALINLGDYSQAIYYCDKSLEIDPNYSLAIKNREIAYNKI